MKGSSKKYATRLRDFFIPHEGNFFRPKSLEQGAFFAYICIALVLKIGFMSLFTALPQTFFFAEVTRSALVALTNDARRERGLAPLQEQSTLQQAAEAKARDILSGGYFAHESPDGKTPWYWFLRAGYRYLYAGENLAIDFLDSADVVSAWLASPGHLANIENPNYKDIAIAVVSGKYGSSEDARERVVVVQLFGNPASSAAPKPSATPKPTAAPTLATPPPAAIPQITPAPTPVETPFAIPSPTLPATADTSPQPSPENTATPSPSSPSSLPSPSPSSAVAIGGADSNNAAVLGSVQLPLAAPPKSGAMLAVYAGTMTLAGRVAENIFFVFLAFVIIASLLNIFIRSDVQHPDLLARALVLTAFFLVLIAVRSQTFLHLEPDVLEGLASQAAP